MSLASVHTYAFVLTSLITEFMLKYSNIYCSELTVFSDEIKKKIFHSFRKTSKFHQFSFICIQSIKIFNFNPCFSDSEKGNNIKSIFPQ